MAVQVIPTVYHWKSAASAGLCTCIGGEVWRRNIFHLLNVLVISAYTGVQSADRKISPLDLQQTVVVNSLGLVDYCRYNLMNFFINYLFIVDTSEHMPRSGNSTIKA